MRHRHAISDEDWARIEDLLPGQPGQHGKVAKDNRLFLDAVLWIARTGAPWRDLPDRLGNWNSTWRRFDRWSRKGVWSRVFEALRGRPQKWDGTGGQAEQALGRSRGGFGTKIHGGVSGLGLPVKLILTAGQAADVTQAGTLIEGVPIEVVIADKGYDS